MRVKTICKFLPVYCSPKYLGLNIVSPNAIFSLSLAIICVWPGRRHSIFTSAVITVPSSSVGDSRGLKNKARRRTEEGELDKGEKGIEMLGTREEERYEEKEEKTGKECRKGEGRQRKRQTVSQGEEDRQTDS